MRICQWSKRIPPADTYKVSATYKDGYKVVATVVIGGPSAVKKAHVIAEAILEKRLILHEKGMEDYTKTNIGVLGSEAIYGKNGNNYIETREVVLVLLHTKKDPRWLFYLEKLRRQPREWRLGDELSWRSSFNF